MFRRQGGGAGDGGGEFPNSRLESLGPQQPQPPPAISSNSNLFLSSSDPPPNFPGFPRFDGGLMDDPDATVNTPAIPSPMEDEDWWANALEEDLFESPLAFDASENGLWNGRFVPPPPRPPFLDDSVATDGLTTCDLCTWAWQRGNAHSSEDAAGEFGGAFTLIVVSIISALIGAIIMVIFLRCRRTKATNNEPSYTSHAPSIHGQKVLAKMLRF